MNLHFDLLTRSWFRFLRSDRRGMLVLAVLIVLTILGQVIVDQIDRPSTAGDARFKQLLACLENDTIAVSESPEPEKFDPNSASADQLSRQGFNRFQSSNLLKYRERGGRFFCAEDLLKIYGVDTPFFEQVRARIEIAPVETKPRRLPVAEQPRVELNSADSLGLVSLRGIGPVFASRIIKYRALLGGFCSVNQLLEVYGFPEETYHALADQLAVDTTMITKIRINFADYSELIRHPYIEKEVVQKILNCRRRNGPFSSTGQLKTCAAIDSAQWTVVSPYLTCR